VPSLTTRPRQERRQLQRRRRDPVPEHIQVGHAGAIGDQPERHPAGVGDHRDTDRVVGGERNDRHDVGQRRAKRIQPPRRAGNVRDREVEQPARVQQPRQADVLSLRNFETPDA
jgi:hypothetical protein